MNFLKNVLLLVLCVSVTTCALGAAAADEQDGRVLTIVQNATRLPGDVCTNIIIPYHGDDYITPLLVQGWQTRLEDDYEGAFMHQMPNNSIVAVAKNGRVAHLAADGTLAKQGRLLHPQHSDMMQIVHTAAIHDYLIALGLKTGDIGIADLGNDADTAILLPSGHAMIHGLVCAQAKDKHQLVVGGDAGLTVFDADTLQEYIPEGEDHESFTLQCCRVTSLALLPEEGKVALNATLKKQPYGHGHLCIYDVSTKTVQRTGITLDRDSSELAVSGQHLMVMDSDMDTGTCRYFLTMHSLTGEALSPERNLYTHVTSVVSLPGAAAILLGVPFYRRLDGPVVKKGGFVEIVGKDGKALQHLSQKDIFSIAALRNGGLATSAIDDGGGALITQWRPMTRQEEQAVEQKKQAKKAHVWQRTKRVAAGASAFFGLAAYLKFKN